MNLKPLCEVIELVMRNDEESLEMLRSRHNMHLLSGNWAGHKECHVANAGDWLLFGQLIRALLILSARVRMTSCLDDGFAVVVSLIDFKMMW